MEKRVKIDSIEYYTLFEEPPGAIRDSPVVLLCHALMSNLHMWDHTIPVLHKAGYSTLRFDHVGHHNTPSLPEHGKALHMDDITRHMHQIANDVTGQNRIFAVIGCSIGGVLALRYAMMFPDDVTRIVSITAPGITVPEAVKPMWSQRIEQFEQDVRTGADTLCHATVNRWFPGNRTEVDPVRHESLQHVKTCTLPGYKTLADAIRNYDYAAEVSEIQTVKCLIVAGSEDTASSAESLESLSRQIPGAAFVSIQEAGHLPPMHKADEFNRILLAFLE